MGWDDTFNNSVRLNVNRVAEISSEEITQLYFSNLSENDIMSLYGVYEQDFILFDYTFKIRNITLPLLE